MHRGLRDVVGWLRVCGVQGAPRGVLMEVARMAAGSGLEGTDASNASAAAAELAWCAEGWRRVA